MDPTRRSDHPRLALLRGVAAGLFAALALGCGSKGELTVTPARLDFGEVDFQEALPDEGLAAQELVLRNSGAAELDLQVLNLDEAHLVLGAAGLVSSAPPTLSTLLPGERLVVTIGVHDYLPGERDTLVEGSFTLDDDSLDAPVEVPWSFTPVRSIDE